MKDILHSKAKINLRLKVINKMNLFNEEFHEIEAINRRINLYDKIVIKKANVDSIDYIYNKNIIVPNQQFEDIVYKSYRFLKQKYSIKDFYNLTIYKNIPIGSGLGGTSSNISSIFSWMNQKYHLGLSIDQMAKELFSFSKDSVYMLYDEMCVVRGVGEEVYPIKDELKHSIIVVYPNIVSSTSVVYKNVSSSNKHTEIKQYSDELIGNDLEKTVTKLYPKIINTKVYLSKFKPIHLFMSGAGSSFVLLVDKKNLNKIYKTIKKETNYFVYKERV